MIAYKKSLLEVDLKDFKVKKKMVLKFVFVFFGKVGFFSKK